MPSVSRARNSPSEYAHACRALNLGLVTEAAVLTPDTEPDVIRRVQRKAVREAFASLRARGDHVSVESLSAEAVLPVSVVRARLAEMKAKIPA